MEHNILDLRHNKKYPFKSMGIGDCFFYPVFDHNNVRTAAHHAQKSTGYRFYCTIIDGDRGCCWRVEWDKLAGVYEVIRAPDSPPMPGVIYAKNRYPFREMGVGDSFNFMPEMFMDIRKAASMAGMRHGKQFRTSPNGVCTRIS